MQKFNLILIFIATTVNICAGEDKWIWSKTKSNQKIRGYYPLADKRVYYTEDQQYARADRDREPTTKRPIPGQPQNDDIDDYDEPTKQNDPFTPPGAAVVPRFGGNFNGFGNFPQLGANFPGNAPNGILVGPGGPTGVIGRPQAAFPAGLAPSAFPLPQGGYPGVSVNSNPGFPGYNGLGQYPGQVAYPNNPQQFAGPQYPQAQFPAAQYPQQPQYTEGYGLANLNPGFNGNPNFNINPSYQGSNFNPNYGFAYDEYPAHVEGKSAQVKAIDKKVDDKVAKNLKKI